MRAFVPIMSLWACTSVTVLTRPALAACPNEATRLQQTYGPHLSDCRAYEQVSPMDKNFNDAMGEPGVSEASPDGERVTFGSLGSFPGIAGASEFPSYVVARAGDGWSLHGLLPQTEVSREATVWGITKDLLYELVNESNSILLQDTLTETSTPFPPGAGFGFEFADAAASDSPILFESETALTEKAQGGVPNTYEWTAGHVSLIAADAVPGPGTLAAHRAERFYYQQGTISQDGSRVFYTSLASHQIFMRENLGEPVAVSQSKAEWRASTSDGSSVFYTESSLGEDEEGLYLWSNPRGEPKPHITTIAGPSAKVQGIAGISSDGTYAYFVAKGVISEANPNIQGKKPEGGGYNFYVWHEGQSNPITYITTLKESFDETDWRGFAQSQAFQSNGEKSSRVTPGGETILFSSVLPLTGYDSRKNFELFLYDASSRHLTCVSCNPSGQPASKSAYLTSTPEGLATRPPERREQFMTRNLSNDGSHVFFETEERLLPVDENGLMDVYEWEKGHLHLISSGQSPSESYFGDASASGRDVFFFTRQPLVISDQDNNVDLYDAREDGGIASQNETPPPPCTGNEQCHDTIAPAPSLASPATTTYQGAGNVPLSTTKPKPKPKCRRGYRRNKRGKCVRAKKAARRARVR